MYKIIFSINLRKARKIRGLTQTELAARSGLQPAAISHFEKGRRKPSFANLKALANALGVTMDYLSGRGNLTTIFSNTKDLCTIIGIPALG